MQQVLGVTGRLIWRYSHHSTGHTISEGVAMSQFHVDNISATAVLTAKMRALESERDARLINDPLAALLCR